MADNGQSYPYISYAQILGIRNKLRSSVPKAIDVDWLMSACSLSEKTAKNMLPQVRTLGLVKEDGTPSDLAHDLRDDGLFKAACQQMLQTVYPQSLRDAHSDGASMTSTVTPWFMRNAKTGEGTARMQASLYLNLMKAELPSAEDAKAAKANRPPKKASPQPAVAPKPAQVRVEEDSEMRAAKNGTPTTPNLHIDLQIHISSEASESQIEAVFKSMAKHLYGR